jgi:hypothetical protein
MTMVSGQGRAIGQICPHQHRPRAVARADGAQRARAADLAPVHVPERARLRLADLDDMRPRSRLADRDASCCDELRRLRRGGHSGWRERQ